MAVDSKIEKSVRPILSAWAASAPGRPYDRFGDAVTIDETSESFVWVVNLHTLYDVRGMPMRCAKPYNEELAAAYQPTNLQSIDVWKEPSPLKAEFIGQEADVPVSSSFEPVHCAKCEEGKITCVRCSGSSDIECKTCQGRGRSPCEQCGGRGREPCTHCRGRGKIPRSVSGTKADESVCSNCNGAGGWPCKQCERGSISCKFCRGRGKFQCADCKGGGIVECAECGGSGKILKGLQIRVSYTPYFARRVVGDPDIPADLFPGELPVKRLGERVYEKKGSALAPESPPREGLKAPMEVLLKEAQTGTEKFDSPAKIVHQEMFIEKIPAYRVRYRFQDKAYECWATPFENRVSARHTPFKDLALTLVRQGEEHARRENFGEAKALLTRAAAVAGDDPSVMASARGLESDWMRRFELWNLCASACVALLISAWIGISHRHSHHLFLPIASFFALSIVGGAALGRWISRNYVWWASKLPKEGVLGLSATVPVLIVLALFSWMAPIARANQWEFDRLLAGRFGASMPDRLTTEDQEYLKRLIAGYEPVGVDVGAAKNALQLEALREEEERRQAAEAARRRALRQQELERQRLDAARRKKAVEAARKKAELAKKKKKPKKKKHWLWGK